MWSRLMILVDAHKMLLVYRNKVMNGILLDSSI